MGFGVRVSGLGSGLEAAGGDECEEQAPHGDEAGGGGGLVRVVVGVRVSVRVSVSRVRVGQGS